MELQTGNPTILAARLPTTRRPARVRFARVNPALRSHARRPFRSPRQAQWFAAPENSTVQALHLRARPGPSSRARAGAQSAPGANPVQPLPSARASSRSLPRATCRPAHLPDRATPIAHADACPRLPKQAVCRVAVACSGSRRESRIKVGRLGALASARRPATTSTPAPPG